MASCASQTLLAYSQAGVATIRHNPVIHDLQRVLFLDFSSHGAWFEYRIRCRAPRVPEVVADRHSSSVCDMLPALYGVLLFHVFRRLTL